MLVLLVLISQVESLKILLKKKVITALTTHACLLIDSEAISPQDYAIIDKEVATSGIISDKGIISEVCGDGDASDNDLEIVDEECTCSLPSNAAVRNALNTWRNHFKAKDPDCLNVLLDLEVTGLASIKQL